MARSRILRPNGNGQTAPPTIRRVRAAGDQIIKIRRTETTTAPTGLAEGELSVNMTKPPQLWVGVPGTVDVSERLLLIGDPMLPAGGAQYEVLTKVSTTDGDVEWRAAGVRPNSNTVIGAGAFAASITGTNNVVVGLNALNTPGAAGLTGNVVLGANALTTTPSHYNVAIGFAAMRFATSNTSNSIAIGREALLNNSGGGHIAIGYGALRNLAGTNADTGSNIGIGLVSCGGNLVTGVHNIIIGTTAAHTLNPPGGSLTNANQSIWIGNGATGGPADSPVNQIAIGHEAAPNGSNTITLGNNAATALYTHAGLVLGDNPTGGAQGPGTINLTGGIFVDGEPLSAMPAGGTQNQVLSKASATDGDVAWRTVVEVPAGGANNAVLTRISPDFLVWRAAGERGNRSIAIGDNIAPSQVGGADNVYLGSGAGATLVSSDHNVLIGASAGRYWWDGVTWQNITSLRHSILIGSQGRSSSDDHGNEIAIGNSYWGRGQNTISIGNQNSTAFYTKAGLVIGGWPNEGNVPAALGFGTVNVQVGYYVNGQQITGAPPSAIIGTTATAGTATTYMRSDAAPALPAPGFTYDVLTLQSSGGIGWAGAGERPNSNTVIGEGAFAASITGTTNVVVGFNALNTPGVANLTGNVAIGNTALRTGASHYNVAIGSGAMGQTTLTTSNNIAIGRDAMSQSGGAGTHIAIGWNALRLVNGPSTTTTGNVSIGRSSGFALVTGRDNVFLGDNTASGIVTHTDSSIFIGSGAGPEADSQVNQIVIGSLVYGGTTTARGRGSNTITLGNADHTALYTHAGLVLGDDPTGGAMGPGTVNATAYYLDGDLFAAEPAGTDKQLQYNDDGAFGGAGITVSSDTNSLNVPNFITTGPTPVAGGWARASEVRAVYDTAAGGGRPSLTTEVYSTGTFPSNIVLRAAAGSVDAPLPISTGRPIGEILFQGFSTRYVPTGDFRTCATISARATEDYETTNGIGGRIRFETNSPGEISSTGIVRLMIGPGLTVGDQSVADMGHGTVNASGGYYVNGEPLSLGIRANNNTVVGEGAFADATTAEDSVAIGFGALAKVTDGSWNTAIGYNALANNEANSNLAIGWGALEANVSSFYNLAIGEEALGALSPTAGVTTDTGNVAVGHRSLIALVQGARNVALGYGAGANPADILDPLLRADNSVFIGAIARPADNDQTNQIVIGHDAIGNGSNTITLGNNDITALHTRASIRARNFIMASSESTFPAFYSRGYNNLWPALYLQCANGPIDAPTFLASGRPLGEISFDGYSERLSGGFSRSVLIRGETVEDFVAGGGYGGRLVFRINGPGEVASNAPTVRARIGLGLSVGDLADMGAGTINAENGYFVNGQQLTGATPSAIIGTTATAGVATTYMRSDAAPALPAPGFTFDVLMLQSSGGIGWGGAGVRPNNNIVFGPTAFNTTSTGDFNFAAGTDALASDVSGRFNTAIGRWALRSNTTGSENTAVGGNRPLDNNTIGVNNTAVGGGLGSNTIGNSNVAVGGGLGGNQDGSRNIGIGTLALSGKWHGDENIAIGTGAASFRVGPTAFRSGNQSIYIGANTQASMEDIVNEIVIGHTARGAGSNTITLGNNDITNLYTRAAITAGNYVGVSGDNNSTHYAGFYATGYDNWASMLVLRSANGPPNVPTFVPSGSPLGDVQFGGYTERLNNFRSAAQIRGWSAEDFVAGGGCAGLLTFHVQAPGEWNGVPFQRAAIRLGLSVGHSSVADMGAGTINAENGYFVAGQRAGFAQSAGWIAGTDPDGAILYTNNTGRTLTILSIVGQREIENTTPAVIDVYSAAPNVAIANGTRVTVVDSFDAGDIAPEQTINLTSGTLTLAPGHRLGLVVAAGAAFDDSVASLSVYLA